MSLVTPAAAYRRLNKLLWMNRLPKATITVVDDATIPRCYGLTIHDEICVHPVILLNSTYKRWGLTLVHEMLHVSEPELRHGKLFDALVNRYWKIARIEIKGLK